MAEQGKTDRAIPAKLPQTRLQLLGGDTQPVQAGCLPYRTHPKGQAFTPRPTTQVQLDDGSSLTFTAPVQVAVDVPHGPADLLQGPGPEPPGAPGALQPGPVPILLLEVTSHCHRVLFVVRVPDVEELRAVGQGVRPRAGERTVRAEHSAAHHSLLWNIHYNNRKNLQTMSSPRL